MGLGSDRIGRKESSRLIMEAINELLGSWSVRKEILYAAQVFWEAIVRKE